MIKIAVTVPDYALFNNCTLNLIIFQIHWGGKNKLSLVFLHCYLYPYLLYELYRIYAKENCVVMLFYSTVRVTKQ